MISPKTAALLLLARSLLASPIDVENVAKRQSCPNIHVFGARETTAPAGYGSSITVVDEILNAHSGATSEVSAPLTREYNAC